MPNHVSNIMSLEEKEDNWELVQDTFKAIQGFMKSDESPFDFNNLIPYPLNFKVMDDAREQAFKAVVKWKSLPQDGYNSGGYQWCIEHWGTKWNAYEIGFGWNDEIAFQTAWKTPIPIWRALSKQFPDVIFQIEYADGDTGCNCGIFKYKAGEQIAFEDMDWRFGQDMRTSLLFAKSVIGQQKSWAYRRDNDDLRKRLDELLRRERENATKPDGSPGDRDPMDCRPENLAALCQRCHLGYDEPDRIATQRRNRLAKRAEQLRQAGQLSLLNE